MPEMVEIEIYRRLAERLVGRTIAEVDANDAWFCKRLTTPELLVGALVGRTIGSTRRIGKLLLLDLDGLIGFVDRAGPSKTAKGVTASGASSAVGDVLDSHMLAGPISAPLRVPPERPFQPASRIGDSRSAVTPESPGCLNDAMVLGLRFGMTGRLIVDGMAGIGELLYSSGRDDPAWDRFGLRFTDGTTMSIRDPRRLGGVELDPDTTLLGIDALTISLKQLRALTVRVAPIKAILLDQAFIAGLGNLLVDEVLWRAALAPNRPGTSITDAELRALHKTIRPTVVTMLDRGGSHLGDVIDERHSNGRCPLDGAAMLKGTFGGRSSWWCPQHQL